MGFASAFARRASADKSLSPPYVPHGILALRSSDFRCLIPRLRAAHKTATYRSRRPISEAAAECPSAGDSRSESKLRRDRVLEPGIAHRIPQAIASAHADPRSCGECRLRAGPAGTMTVANPAAANHARETLCASEKTNGTKTEIAMRTLLTTVLVAAGLALAGISGAAAAPARGTPILIDVTLVTHCPATKADGGGYWRCCTVLVRICPKSKGKGGLPGYCYRKSVKRCH